MRRIVGFSLAVALAFTSLTAPPRANAQLAIGISVDVMPPPLPVYVQPPIPAPAGQFDCGRGWRLEPACHRRIFVE
jgi:hypothetical protein